MNRPAAVEDLMHRDSQGLTDDWHASIAAYIRELEKHPRLAVPPPARDWKNSEWKTFHVEYDLRYERAIDNIVAISRFNECQFGTSEPPIMGWGPGTRFDRGPSPDFLLNAVDFDEGKWPGWVVTAAVAVTVVALIVATALRLIHWTAAA